MKPKKTWVVVADGARARFFASAGPGQGLVQIPDGVLEGDRSLARETGSDRPGRSFESVGDTRHAVQPRTDPREDMEKAFLATVIERLEAGLRDAAFDRLVVVAAPAALGMLRKALPASLAGHVVATLDKDLTRAPLDLIEREVAGAVTL